MKIGWRFKRVSFYISPNLLVPGTLSSSSDSKKMCLRGGVGGTFEELFSSNVVGDNVKKVYATRVKVTTNV